MDVRCKNCDKLFRVPDEKVTAKGIKFACTRCGEYVIARREDHEKAAVSFPDKVEAGPKPAEGAQAPAIVKPTEQEPTPGPQPVALPNTGAMEVRCGKCNKIFRVPKEKFSGEGIKFLCTRCGEYVKITREEFERHFHPQTASLQAPEALPTEHPSPFDQSSSPGGPTTVTEPVPAYGPGPIQAPMSAPTIGLKFTSEVRQRVEPVAPNELKPEDLLSEMPAAYSSGPEAPEALPMEHPSPFDQVSSPAELTTVKEPAPADGLEPIQTELRTGPTGILQGEPGKGPEPAQQPTIEPAAKSASMPETAPTTPSAVHRPEPPVPLETPRKEIVPPAAAKKASAAASFSWVEKALLLVIVVIFISFVGYGLFTYLQASAKKEMKAASTTSSIEGLLITNVTNTKDADGDLLITGTVENALDKENAAWYVVVEAYNAQGVVIDKLRLLNGKQLYSRRDYQLFEKRGINIQELKAKNLDEQGMLIPPKGSVQFTIRYVQPPDTMASFKPMLRTFDPVRLFKEIVEDSK